jgi:hypothetical protein
LKEASRPLAAAASTLVLVGGLAALAVPSRASAQALPFLPPGDLRLRHELQMAADAGQVPLATTWPIPTLDLPPESREALRAYTQPGSARDAGWFANGGSRPMRLRSFADTPREHGEIGVQAGWAAGDYAGGTFRVSYAFDPQDDRHYRFDDSYVAWRAGNWWLSAGFQQRWWGPGHDGSLILSNNARPLPSLALTRASSKPFESKWLSWIGPWNLTTFMGKFEDGNSGYPHPLLWGMRVNFRPLRSLEIGLSRTAQWCRPGVCDASAFGDVLLARDNRGENVSAENEPGNQLAGLDLRWRLPAGIPAAVYAQMNGESIDNRDWRPRRQTVLVGAEVWSAADGGGSWRAFAEFAGTRCGEWSTPAADRSPWGCAYESGLFSGGYRTRGRVIGHAADRDSQVFTLGGLYAPAAGPAFEMRVRRAKLNRGATAAPSPTHTVAAMASDLWNVELKLEGHWRRWTFSAGVGGDYLEPAGHDPVTTGRGFLSIGSQW